MSVSAGISWQAVSLGRFTADPHTRTAVLCPCLKTTVFVHVINALTGFNGSGDNTGIFEIASISSNIFIR